MGKKPYKLCNWIKKWWKAILIIVLGIAFFVGNLCVLLCVKDLNKQSALLTFFSGWVSGIATIILGAIAIEQNRKYKEENDEVELSIRQREWRIEQKESIKLYLDGIVSIYNEIQTYQYSKIIDECIYKLHESPNTIIDMAYYHKLRCLYDKLIYTAINYPYYFDGTEELCAQCHIYISDLVIQLNNLEEKIENGDAEFLEELYDKYSELMEKFNSYISMIRVFIVSKMTNETPENVEDKLKEMYDKQIAWREKLQSQLKQEQSNG